VCSQWKLIGNFAEEVAKRVDKKNKACNNMCQQAEQNLRSIADKHDELNRAAETLKMEIEGGIGTLSGILDEREQVCSSTQPMKCGGGALPPEVHTSRRVCVWLSSGVVRFSLSLSWQGMMAGTEELEFSKTRTLQDMLDELNNNKASLQQASLPSNYIVLMK
jgi:uncharacterized protein YukE